MLRPEDLIHGVAFHERVDRVSVNETNSTLRALLCPYTNRADSSVREQFVEF
jgi:hypothetical protein